MPGENDDAQTASVQGQKFLRYRSVRQSAAAKEDPAAAPQDPSPPPPLPQTSQTSLTRLPSRYHRRPPTAPQSAPSPTAEPPLPASLNNTATVSRPRGRTVNGTTTEQDGAQGRQTQNGTTRRMVIQHSDSRPPTARPTTSKSTPRKQTLTSSATPPSPDELRRSLEAAREEARLLLEGEQDRVRALRQQEARRRHEEREKRRRQEEKLAQEARQREAEEAARQEARKRLERPRHEQGVDEQHEAPAPPTSEAVLDSNKSRTRTMVIGGQCASNTQGKRAHHQRASSAIEQLQQKPKQSHTRTRSAGKNDEKHDNEAPVPKPNFDAPVSAVNAGERRVSVKCKEAFLTLPVTPSTTSKDILSSASVCMSERIDPGTAVLLESFAQLGLERPLRRYERIRDVMNSWDNDTQNHLFIMAEGECAAPGLQVADAPNQQPYETVVNLYHSQKPGKWDKRWLRLREDGQITTSKNENCIDSTNICHLSDFDLYTPTARQIKKLKPPKKLCFALKSQEKSAMFLDGANFVHFFCTKDKTVADRWYHAVHSWRSWYLVNMLGEGQQKPTDAAERFKLGSRPGTRGSKESLPYVLGSFKPLLDFGSAFEGNRKPEPDVAHRPSQSDDRRPLIDFVPERPSIDEKPSGPKFPSKPQGAPPTSFPRKYMIESATSGNVDDTDGPFTGTGLLARSASRRSQGGQRSSGGAPGKPLVDLTPTSEFTDGSLLRKMEAMAPHQGVMEPKIDRQKRREVDIVVGEGF